MVERLIAGDSREWVVNVKEHFQCLHPDAEPTAFIRTAAGCLVKVPAKRRSDTVRIELSPEASEKLPEGESILLMQMTYGDSYRKTVALRFPRQKLHHRYAKPHVQQRKRADGPGRVLGKTGVSRMLQAAWS